MARKPRPKKSEALEIRVSHEDKQAFMEAVSRRGTTASDVIRKAMDVFVRNGHVRRRNIMITASLIAVSAAALVIQTNPGGEAQTYSGINEFAEMDADGNRSLTLEEYRAFRDTAYNNLSGANGAGAFGSAAGALLASHGDVVPAGFGRRARENPESIPESCWDALEDSWQAYISDHHQTMDANSDGQVSVLEYSERRTNRLRAQFEHMDRNGDGLLGPYEVMPSAEDEAAMPASTPRNRPAHVAICFGAIPPEQREPMSEAYRTQSRTTLMAIWDLDADGAVSWAEFHASMVG
jgi:hypothetical protein